ncbi:uncharacterized protein BDV14DRAFT_203503 [Aspergillus stella-maris]|uniref:uncharacterized protein n=1 Tax=Aspergillus stella-maris TaxID=1810926 RepID=UPI003CCCCB61
MPNGEKNPELEIRCILCAACIPTTKDTGLRGRQSWTTLGKRADGNRRSVTVPAAEVEEMAFDSRTRWASYYRTILAEPESDNVFLSGIAYGSRSRFLPRPVPINPLRARLHNARGQVEDRWNVTYAMADILGTDQNGDVEKRTGYPVHLDCWKLAGRVLGQDRLQGSQNLRTFIQAAESFWRQEKNRPGWHLDFKSVHAVGSNWEMYGCFEQGPVWGDKRHDEIPAAQLSGPFYGYRTKFGIGIWHMQGSPFWIHEIQELIKRATKEPVPEPGIQKQGGKQSRKKKKERTVTMASPNVNVPLDIALEIIEVIYRSDSPPQEKIDDFDNLIQAFQWKIPAVCWAGRCNPDLVFEIADLAASTSAHSINWAKLCLEFEQLAVDPHWFCRSGLNYRKRVLKVLRGIKEGIEGSDNANTT